MTGGATCMDIVSAEQKAAEQRTAGKGDKPRNTSHNRSNNFMKFSIQLTRFAGLLTAALFAGAGGVFTLHANDASPKPAQQLFNSPAEAVKALQAATQAKDT